MIIVHFTEACKLETVSIDGEQLSAWEGTFAVLQSEPVINQPVGDLAVSLLARDDVHRVDIDYRLPGELVIKTNRFESVCFVVGQQSGKLFGLNRHGRLVYPDWERVDWEQPVFTGLETGDVFSFCTDPRVRPVIDQLQHMRECRGELFRLVAELDFSEKDYLRATIAGVPFCLMIRPHRLIEDFDRFIDFVQNYETDLSGVTRVDLRFADMVICGRSE